MATTFPFLRLPYELRVEVIKHHIQPFDVLTVLRMATAEERSPAKRIRALPKRKSCFLYLCRDLKEAGKEALLSCFTGTFNVVVENWNLPWTDILEPFNEFVLWWLPRSAPLEHIKVMRFQVKHVYRMYHEFITYGSPRSPGSQSWDQLSASISEDTRLSSLRKIEFDLEFVAGMFWKARRGRKYSEVFSAFSGGYMNWFLLDMLEPHLPQSEKTDQVGLARADGKRVNFHLYVRWISQPRPGQDIDWAGVKLRIERPNEVCVIGRDVVRVDGRVFNSRMVD